MAKKRGGGSKKGRQSMRHKARYAQQRVRTEANKARRKLRWEMFVAESRARKKKSP